jgi:hypothetical protein
MVLENIVKTTADYIDVFRFIPGYQPEIVTTGKEPLILLLLAFLITFGLTRLYTRLARIRGWGSGSVDGVHLHHMVVGILIVLVTGLVTIAVWPTGLGRDLVAICFGSGAALTLDEFALSLYLKDVYWSPEGRSSIDATVMGVILAALLMVGVSPFGIHDSSAAPRAVAFGLVGVNIVVCAVTLLKGKLMLGIVSVFLPMFGLLGALRLSKPTAPWARWFYKHDAGRMKRCHARYDHGASSLHRLNDWFTDLIGGSPSKPSPTDAGRLDQ